MFLSLCIRGVRLGHGAERRANRSEREIDLGRPISLDDFPAFNGIESEYTGGHDSVCHSTKEHVRGEIHTNTAGSSFAILKRGIMGIYNKVSKEYLHRYLWQFEFIWNTRYLNDGERTVIKTSEGNRLRYKAAA